MKQKYIFWGDKIISKKGVKQTDYSIKYTYTPNNIDVIEKAEKGDYEIGVKY